MKKMKREKYEEEEEKMEGGRWRARGRD